MSPIKSKHRKPVFYLILNVGKWKAYLPKSEIIQGCPISLHLFFTILKSQLKQQVKGRNEKDTNRKRRSKYVCE